MRLVVLNNSGNVGKSTICQHMLYPRLKYNILRIETLNTDGEATGERLSAEDFDKIFNKILSSDDVIVDVGASNIATFKTKIETDFEGAHNFIDYFLIPVTPDEKQQRDTIKTISDLNAQGVENDKMRVILNRVNSKRDIKEQFNILYTSDMLDVINFELNDVLPVVFESSLFKTLERAKLTYNTVKEFKTSSEFDEELKGKIGKEKIELELQKFYRLGFEAYQKNLQTAFETLNLI
ncbi:transcriptional regulator [Arsenophonus sp.]|uniref:transcriptional regulator n=1 Tax=Arsenophonus sp. TaxID=1872640 RepID=UPI00285760AC|nr:transcriptional regulator [Arsenophonus sp.]MDR5615089.1 transcriptional regulator [Arsenophonus sp.]